MGNLVCKGAGERGMSCVQNGEGDHKSMTSVKLREISPRSSPVGKNNGAAVYNGMHYWLSTLFYSY